VCPPQSLHGLLLTTRWMTVGSPQLTACGSASLWQRRSLSHTTFCATQDMFEK
jgi:hypothetical protein